MKVERLLLKNFRNITESQLNPDPGLNFLVGANGQGKTSFLEAIGYLSNLRSFRGSKSAELIRYETNSAEVLCSIVSIDEIGESWRTDLSVLFTMTDREQHKASKVAFINGKPFHSSLNYLSQRFGSYQMGFHSVVFNPSDHDLIRGDPSTRRAYLDGVLSAEDIEYLKALQKCRKALEHRNALLKRGNTRSNREALHGFTEALSQYSAIITIKRLMWIERLKPFLKEASRYIAPRQPNLQLLYCTNWAPEIENLSINNHRLSSIHFTGQSHLPSLEQLEQVFWKRVSTLEEAEWKTGHSLVGPHRDDWAFFLSDQPLKGHGSQGEVRSALLALKLSEIEMFRNATGHRPLFLLDDFSSELDQERRSFLLKFLLETDLQVFVTTTEESSFVGKRYWVSAGHLKEGEHGHSRESRNELDRRE